MALEKIVIIFKKTCTRQKEYYAVYVILVMRNSKERILYSILNVLWTIIINRIYLLCIFTVYTTSISYTLADIKTLSAKKQQQKSH